MIASLLKRMLLASAVALPLAANATEYTVNTVIDENDGVGVGAGTSLREAITEANSEAGPHTIDFAPSLTSSGPTTITLLSALPAISRDMDIAGPGANLLSISAGNTTRVLQIALNTAVTMENLTLRDGAALTPGPVSSPVHDGGGLLV